MIRLIQNERYFQVQGDHLGCVKPLLDTKTKVLFYYCAHAQDALPEKWREYKQQLSFWPDCRFVFLHFLWGNLHTSPVHGSNTKTEYFLLCQREV